MRITRFLLFLLVLFMLPGMTRTVEAVCTPSATALCLLAGRFQVEIEWRDEAGNAYTLPDTAQSGQGQAVVVNDGTGYFHLEAGAKECLFP